MGQFEINFANIGSAQLSSYFWLDVTLVVRSTII